MNVPLKQYWDLLADYIKPQKARFALLTALLLGSIGLQIVNPQIMRYFIDAATQEQATGSLTNAALAFITVALLQQVVGVGATYVGENVAWSATNALRADLYQHCLKLGMSFHNQHAPGELIERIDGDVAELASFFSQLVISVIGNFILLCGILFVLTLEDWRLGLAFGAFAVVTLYALNRVRDLAVPHFKAYRAASADMFSFLEEQLAGTEDVRSSGAVDFALYELHKLQYAMMIHDGKSEAMAWVADFTTRMLMVLGTALAFVIGYTLYQNGAITIGTAYLITHYIGLLSRPIRELARQAESAQKIGASIERLRDLRRIENEIQDGPGASLPGGPLALAFDDVSFAYAGNERVLQELSFELEPGAVLGLLGRTGSGKTTLARLIFRLYEPTAGRVMLDSVDLRSARINALRQRVAFVTQDVQLFHASVCDNLTFFSASQIPDEQIRAVIEELELADWFQALPEGLDTQLETGGRGLSAGEAQLLALARVFLRDPGLVVLDEASSRLDPATEARIERAVDKLLKNRSAIVIAHRLRTVQRADEIMILEEGRIAEHGPRQQLASDPGSRFYSLLQTGLQEVLV